MPKFAHLRRHRNDDNSIECRGGITLAYEAAEQGGYKYALAICHEHDNYNKKVGRAKSAGRLNSTSHVQWCAATTAADLIQHVLGHIPSRWMKKP